LATSEQIERLVAEVLQIIPSFASGRGRFSITAEVEEWQRQFLRVVDDRYLTAFKPDTNDVVTLVELVNYYTLVHPTAPRFPRHDGVPLLTPVRMLSTIVGYALFEMLVRKLGSGSRGPSSLDKLLRRFETDSCCADLVKDLKLLNSQMRYKESGQSFNLYQRLKRGRDRLLHGNVLRTFEPEGWLLVLLIDLIVLHVMRRQMSNYKPNM
jgi:hypothetical protein